MPERALLALQGPQAVTALARLVSGVDKGLESFRSLPMLICWGERDFVFDRHFLAQWERRFPAAEVHRYPDGGHYILEDMKEEIIPLIARFLDRTSGKGQSERP